MTSKITLFINELCSTFSFKEQKIVRKSFQRGVLFMEDTLTPMWIELFKIDHKDNPEYWKYHDFWWTLDLKNREANFIFLMNKIDKKDIKSLDYIREFINSIS